ncbi:hypothetical protein L1987_34894 [Smallanthus sonchifolius]|uniref:Uncharacterized protein n=1 Tax=Smallanthus sonchifolius TaxID=185202 RepID=A0ACB9HWT9_9ASTR|nr:hypothetical protein L1987_34894 [Smallanthus sonchifolius]
MRSSLPVPPTSGGVDYHYIRLPEGLPDDVLDTFPTFLYSQTVMPETETDHTHPNSFPPLTLNKLYPQSFFVTLDHKISDLQPLLPYLLLRFAKPQNPTKTPVLLDLYSGSSDGEGNDVSSVASRKILPASSMTWVRNLLRYIGSGAGLGSETLMGIVNHFHQIFIQRVFVIHVCVFCSELVIV